MKGKYFSIFLLLAIGISALFTGCFSSWQGDKAVLSINFGGSSRSAAWPPDEFTQATLEHHIQLEGPSGIQNHTFEPGVSSASFTLVPGHWTIKAESFLDKELYAKGSAGVELKPGRNNPVSIKMNFAGKEDRVYMDVNTWEELKTAVEGTNAYSTFITLKGTSMTANSAITLDNPMQYIYLWADAPGGITITRDSSFTGIFFRIYSGVLTMGGDEDQQSYEPITLHGGGQTAAPLKSTIIYNRSGIFYLIGGTITENNGSAFGGVENNGTFYMYAGEISYNNSAPTGTTGSGGVFNTGTFYMEAGSISYNTSSANGGGVLNTGTFSMNAGEIKNNTSVAGDVGGGGVFNQGGTFYMNGGEISYNTSSSNGGGVLNFKTFYMEAGEISNNTASDNGGGMYNNGTFIMNAGEISYNNAGNNGGGVHNESTFAMEAGEISDNTSSVNGGGVYNSAFGKFQMAGGSLSGNTAGSNGNGVYYNDDVYSNSTFAMSGSAYLAPGDDLCLAAGTMITVTDLLTAREPQSPLFEITLGSVPASGTSLQVLISDPPGYESEFAQFQCTSDGINYGIDSDGFVHIP